MFVEREFDRRFIWVAQSGETEEAADERGLENDLNGYRVRIVTQKPRPAKALRSRLAR